MADLKEAEGAQEAFPGRDLPTAGVRRRLMATLADMVIFVGLSVVLCLPLLRAMPDLSADGTAIDAVSSLAQDTPWLSHVAGIGGLWVALWWCYFLVGWGLMGCTPGKWLLGLRVVDHQGRCPIGASRAAMRLLAYMASSVTLIGGHMLAVLRGDRLALHDVLAGTRVVRWKRKPRSSSEVKPQAEN
ncbi:MAG: RDD family protein [Acidobacteria bacterium]|nr:RDD family protein [Acidobacteriota bacterium]